MIWSKSSDLCGSLDGHKSKSSFPTGDSTNTHTSSMTAVLNRDDVTVNKVKDKSRWLQPWEDV